MSGFKNSIIETNWNPSGSPAIYKLIETFAEDNNEVSIIFTAKESGFSYKDIWDEISDKKIKIKGLEANTIVLTGVKKIPRIFGRYRGHISSIRQTIKVWKFHKKFKPDIFYVDRSNILAGSIISRFTNTPVILRVLGVTPSMKKMLNGKSITQKIDRWCYNSPFSLVIGTEDGSGIANFLNQILNKKTPREIKINGVDKPLKTKDPNMLIDKINIAILGRIDPYKQTTEIIETFLSLEDKYKKNIIVHIIGDGDNLEELKNKARDSSDGSNFIFYGSVPHNKVTEILLKCNLYISFNIMGNLSNSNLEALAAGLSFILPEADYKNHRDTNTFMYIPDQICIKLPLKNFQKSLKLQLQQLVDNPENLLKLQSYPRDYIDKLENWEERIDWEKKLIRNIIK
ncbi:MAG: hypothetical protein CFH01_00106 [Alphaproteobacteria bacterium MarineAlpha2_Bin1]|nr:MAG: hypothetical protein CFH01_00106 [Alphaproteobacteria bacterium MarineAlpha2_Bin1]|tara:strand:+ start:114 stop:1313 length:1200 start_codon:yes stop_codon:yes gene_type:complete